MGEVTRLHGPGASGRPAADLETARALVRAGRLRDAWEILTALPDLDAADLELRGTLAYLIGDARSYFEDMGAAFQAYDDPAAAARCAAWLAIMHLIRGEAGHSSGWLATARRLSDEHGECAATAYLEVTPILSDQSPGRDQAIAIAREMNQIARRHHDVDAVALTGQTFGQLLIHAGRADEGRELMDEAMVAATSGQLSSPLVEILAYLAVMEGCRLLCDVTRAREWTTAIGRLQSRSPDLTAFRGVLRLRRAEVGFLSGAWTDALDELDEVSDKPLQGAAWLLRADILRERGAYDEAAHAYDEAAARGGDAAPGRALLHLARGEHELARSLIRRVLSERNDACDRAVVLPAAVVVLVATAVEEAAELADELAAAAALLSSPLLEARARHAAGLVALHRGAGEEAVVELRRAIGGFADLRIPGELARSRAEAARAYALAGDRTLSDLERTRAEATAAELGLVLESSAPDGASDSLLSAREREVLRLLASGSTNREIAESLTLSPRTVDRHVSNILAKTGSSSRTAAASYAVEHGLL